MKRLWALTDDAVFMSRFHGWFTVLWLVAAFPICIWLSESVPFLVFISVYAVVASHWAAQQAAKVEIKQDAADKKR